MNDDTKRKTAVVIGASSGFGKIVAFRLLERGFVVYATARRLDLMKELEKAGADLLFIDVRDDDSVKTAINRIIKERDFIDVVVNNAGYGTFGSIENTPIEEVQRQFDTNVCGMARVNNAVLPYMRKRRSGRIIITASMSSHISTAGSGWYAATKHALSAMTTALRMEVYDLGIKVIQIEPGPVKTDFGDVAFSGYDGLVHDNDYKLLMNGFKKHMIKTYLKSPPPDSTIDAMIKAATARNPKPVYRTTFQAKALPMIYAIVGIRWFTRIVLMTLKKQAD
ncbi:MAG: SDR family NAD(P)-dependent oxidoreductase [Planctomycetota bacterium]|jgi:NADP-dependent 3-hydroxy acid dehydrogenase YdfG